MRADGFREMYTLQTSDGYELVDTAIGLIRYLLPDCTTTELQELLTRDIPNVRNAINAAGFRSDQAAAQKARDLRARFVARAPVGVFVPRVFDECVPEPIEWTAGLEAEAVAQGQDGPHDAA